MPITPVITTAGLEAVLNETNNGLSARITHIALGDGAWAPDNTATALRSERRRVAISNGSRIQPTQIHITAVENGEVEYWIREIGFILDDGTLLAVWSDPTNPLAYKARDVDVLLAFDLLLSALPEDSIEVIGTGGVHLPPGSQTILGVVRFATDDEARAGSLNNVAMTPEGTRLHGDARYSRLGHRHRWTNIDGRPSTYPPNEHNHDWDDVYGKPTNFRPSSHTHPWSQVTGKPSTFSPSSHTHPWSQVTGKPSTYTPATHNHSWSELQNRPTTFPPSSHRHLWSQIDGKPSTYQPERHRHPWTELLGVPNSFPPSQHNHSWSAITGKPTTYPPNNHNHDDRYDARYDARYVRRDRFHITHGFTRTLRRLETDRTGYNNWLYNYAFVTPPSGYSIRDLMGFTASVGIIFFRGDVNSDDAFWCRWRAETDENRVRIICANSENRADSAGAASYVNYLAIWRRN